MADAEFLRAKANQCRELITQAKVPEVIAQLELWARDFEKEAIRAEADAPAVVVIAPQSSRGS
jgi:hypothetical protein